MKFSQKFNNDYNWFLSIKDFFNFDGCNWYLNKRGLDIIQYDQNGLTAKECFYLYDSQGIIKPTSEPEILKQVLKVKGSVNLHIKMYAEDRAKGVLPKVEFDKIIIQINPPVWFVEAVENQKHKYYDECIC